MTRPTVPVEVDLAAAVDLIVRCTDEARAARGRVDVVVPGGRGLVPLRDPLAARGLPGPDWLLHLSDERVVPRGHPDRNADAVAALLDPRRPGPTPLGPPDDDRGLPSAAGWATALADVPRFALTVLGLGSDGHTAGLFPGRPSGVSTDAPDVLEVDPAGDLPHRRLSLSARRLARTAAVLLVAVGPGKEAVIDAVRRGDDGDAPTGALVGPPRYLLVVPDAERSRKSSRV